MLIALLVLASLGHGIYAAPVGEAETENHARAMDQFIRGTVADQMEDYYRAIFHYQEALRYDSTSAFIHVALAQDYLLLGNPGLATDLLDRALRVRPSYVPALELKALVLRGTGDLKAARDILRRLAELQPQETSYLRQLLSVHLSLEEFEQAEAAYRKIVEVEGETDLLTRQVLAVYLASDQPDRAIGLIERLLATDSTDAGLVYTLGTTYLQKGDSARGEQYILKANRMDPEESRFWIGRAVMAMERSQFEAAVAIADSAEAHVQNDPTLYSLKGTALNRLGRTAEAVTALSRAIELDSTQFVALGTLALIYDRMDSLEQTVDLYERAVRLSDSAAIYLNNLAYTYATRGIELERAQRLSQEALEREPENGSYLDTMGWILHRLGRHDEALDYLKQAIRRSPGSADILEHLGDVYAIKGSPSKAQKYYRQALQLDPANETLRRKAAR